MNINDHSQQLCLVQKVPVVWGVGSARCSGDVHFVRRGGGATIERRLRRPPLQRRTLHLGPRRLGHAHLAGARLAAVGTAFAGLARPLPFVSLPFRSLSLLNKYLIKCIIQEKSVLGRLDNNCEQTVCSNMCFLR